MDWALLMASKEYFKNTTEHFKGEKLQYEEKISDEK